MFAVELVEHDVEEVKLELRKAIMIQDTQMMRMQIDIADIEELDITTIEEGKAPWWGQTPLYLACQYCDDEEESVAMVVELVRLGQSHNWVNKLDSGGHSPLWVAAKKGSIEVVKVLVAEGANVNQYTREMRGPLWNACWNGHLDIAAFLLEKGADVDMVCTEGHTGTTPMQAAIAGKDEVWPEPLNNQKPPIRRHTDLAYFIKQMIKTKKKKAMKGKLHAAADTVLAEVRLTKHVGECLFTPNDVTKALQRLEQKKERDEAERVALAQAEADELQRKLDEEDMQALLANTGD